MTIHEVTALLSMVDEFARLDTIVLTNTTGVLF